MNEDFRRTDLRPFELLQRARDLVAQDYWLFVGITTVAWLLASLVPFAILLGPMMCGTYLVYRAKQNGEPVEFAMLFRGFDHFVQSLIAALLKLVVSFVAILPFVALYLFGVVVTAEGMDDGSPLPFFGVMALFYASLALVMLLVSAVFLFTFPLIVDRGADGVQAISLSARAAAANPLAVLKVALMNAVLMAVGLACCYVGAFFVFPFTFGMIWLAYREVFPPLSAAPSTEDPLSGV